MKRAPSFRDRDREARRNAKELDEAASRQRRMAISGPAPDTGVLGPSDRITTIAFRDQTKKSYTPKETKQRLRERAARIGLDVSEFD